jgi:hypothetical protein
MPASSFGLLLAAAEDGTEIDDSAYECDGFRTWDQLVDCSFFVLSFRIPFPFERIECVCKLFFGEAMALFSW